MSKLKDPTQHLKNFNTLAHQYLITKSDKCLEDLSKNVNVLSQITSNDVWDIKNGDVSNVLQNSAQVIHQLDYKQNLVWSLIKILSHISLSNKPNHLCKFELVPVLARLLNSLPCTTHNRTNKLLELLLYLVQDFEVGGIESYMMTLCADLLNFISGKDAETAKLAALVLSVLLRRNFYVANILFIHCDAALQQVRELRLPQTDPTSLIIESIETRLQHYNLNSSMNTSVLKHLLDRIVNTVDISYRNEDITMIRFYSGFVHDLGHYFKCSSGCFKSVDCSDLLSKLISVANFSKGGARLWQEYLQFCDSFVSCLSNTDSLNVFNSMFKIVTNRLEVENFKESWAALDLLITCLHKVKQDELTPADKRNLALQTDQILPGLSNIIISPCTTDNQLITNISCFRLLYTLNSIEQISSTSITSSLAPPDKIYQAFLKDLETCTDVGMKARLSVNLYSLCSSLSTATTSWTTAFNNIQTNATMMKAIAQAVKESLLGNDDIKTGVNILAASNNSTLLAESTNSSQQQNGARFSADIAGSAEFSYTLPDYSQKLQQCLDDITSATARLTVEEEERILPQILEIQNFNRQEDKKIIKNLEASLAAAELNITNKTWTIQSMTSQMDNLHYQLAAVAGRFAAARAENETIRSQHDSTNVQSKGEIEKLSMELKKTTSDLEAECQKTSEAADNYERLKTDFNKMKNELQTLIKDREIQETALKDAKAALHKRDEKIKKELKQMDELQTKMEKSSKKIEKLEKSNKSLETLTSGQEEALKKKDKQLEALQRENEELKRIRDTIFNLSKSTSAPTC